MCFHTNYPSFGFYLLVHLPTSDSLALLLIWSAIIVEFQIIDDRYLRVQVRQLLNGSG